MRFVLIHGGWHGAWCWSRTIPELERLGHEAIAIDLPGFGERVDEECTMANHREAVLSVMEQGDVLVGHSGGGFEITMTADAAPELVGHLVYLAASLPREGGTHADMMSETAFAVTESSDDTQSEAITDKQAGLTESVEVGPDGQWTFTLKGASEMFYNDCDEQTARWAWERLTYPNADEFVKTPVSVPRFWQSDIPRSFIRCLQDHAQPDWHAKMVAERLGVQPLEIDTSHSPFLSRPAEFAELLVHATTTVPVGPVRPQ